jgi:hypothetical protein
MNCLKDHQTDMDEKIHKLAIEMGIDTKNMTTAQLVDEIRVKMRNKADQ